MSLISNAQAATDLERQVDQAAIRLLDALVRGDRRQALQALAESKTLDLPAARLTLAAWIGEQLADPTKETDA